MIVCPLCCWPLVLTGVSCCTFQSCVFTLLICGSFILFVVMCGCACLLDGGGGYLAAASMCECIYIYIYIYISYIPQTKTSVKVGVLTSFFSNSPVFQDCWWSA